MVGAGRWQVSVGGGTQPVWSRDGKTVYYRNAANIVAASVSAGTAFSILSQHDVAQDLYSRENTINYDEIPGKGLVVVVPLDQGMQFNTVVNWIEEAKARLGRSAP
jgi:hypothetical protein